MDNTDLKASSDAFSEALKSALAVVTESAGKIADRPVPLFFPGGINHIELAFKVPPNIDIHLTISGDKPKTGGSSALASSQGANYDPAVDPDVFEDKPLRIAADLPWRVAECLDVLRSAINVQYPNRRKDSDGTIGDYHHCHGGTPNTSDHCAWIVDGKFGVVSALDITHDPKAGCDAGVLAERLIALQDSRIKYVIWNRQIAASYKVGSTPAWQWRPYTGEDPHTDHFHLSVKSEKSEYDNTDNWRLWDAT